MTTYDAVPLTALQLSSDQIDAIRNQYPEFDGVFQTDADVDYAIPLSLIESGLEGEEVNTTFLLEFFQETNIRPATLFEYCATVFNYVSQKDPQTQKDIIATVDAQNNDTSADDVRDELDQLEKHIDGSSFFDFLKINYQQKANDLSEQLQYENEEKPKENDVWEINLVNVQGVDADDDTKPITVVIEGFIIPDEVETETFFDSPALVRVVGEYDEYMGLEEGDMFVATPNAFANGTHITNLDET